MDNDNEDEDMDDEFNEPQMSSVPNPIPEVRSPSQHKRGRPPKLRRELQVSLRPLSLSSTSTQILIRGNSSSGASTTGKWPSEWPSDGPTDDLKRGKSSQFQPKINSSKNSGEEKSTSSGGDDNGEMSDHKSAPDTDSNQQDDESEYFSWNDDFGFYRPLRAAAAAALEAVQSRKTQDELIRLRLRNKVLLKLPLPRGRNRRALLRKSNLQPQVTRSVPEKAITLTGKSIFHNETYYQAGDIASIIGDDETEYYCQIQSVVRDHNFISGCSIRWLVPKLGIHRPSECFSPTDYYMCENLPEELVSLDLLESVMHCSLDYFHRDKLLHPVKGVVHMRLGDPLVIAEKLPVEPSNPPEPEVRLTEIADQECS